MRQSFELVSIRKSINRRFYWAEVEYKGEPVPCGFHPDQFPKDLQEQVYTWHKKAKRWKNAIINAVVVYDTVSNDNHLVNGRIIGIHGANANKGFTF